MTTLSAPHGGALVDLYVRGAERAELLARLPELPSLTLDMRQLCDLEMLLSGAFSPLRGFMGEADHSSTCRHMRLADGTLWPIPVTLDVSAKAAENIGAGDTVVLRDAEGTPLAALEVGDKWLPDREAEMRAVYGTTDSLHPGVRHLREHAGPVCLGGRVLGLEAPRQYDFRHLRLTPAQLRARLETLGQHRVVAFQTRNPMHRAHVELTVQAAQAADAHLLIHPCVGMTRPGDIDHFTRVRCYEKTLPHYADGTATLALMPLAMRMAGPREALWHAIIRKNYGATHFIVGRDHAGPGNDAQGQPFYGPYDAQELVAAHEAELGITMMPFQHMVYVRERDAYLPHDEVAADQTVLNISGTELRQRLRDGDEIPGWFTFPEVAVELRRTHPPRHRQGFCVFFTGLSGAGKSTLANALLARLMEIGTRPVTLLDGDVVRLNLSSELGFSREHRDLNIQRIAFVANEITRNGGIALCAPIAPYANARRQAREQIDSHGKFVEVHVATPLEVCEARDSKGLYALARAGKIKEFTGISDPYEEPQAPELRIDTSTMPPEQAVEVIMQELQSLGLVANPR